MHSTHYHPLHLRNRIEFRAATYNYIYIHTYHQFHVFVLLRLLLDRLRIDGRLLYLGLLLMSTLGLLLLGDWQTLGSKDQCNNFSISNTNISSSGEEAHTLCDSQTCAPVELLTENTLCSGSKNSTIYRLQDLIKESAHITVYQPQEQIESMSKLKEVSHCPLCSNYSSGACLTFVIESGVLCISEEGQETLLQEQTKSALLYSIPEYQTQMCIAVSEELAAEGLNSTCFSLPRTLMKEINSLSFFATLLSQQQCEGQSGSPYYCYWNQDSLIADQHCPDCPALCRSTHKIPHFAQVFISVGLLTIVAGGGVWVIGGMMVEVSPAKLLVKFLTC